MHGRTSTRGKLLQRGREHAAAGKVAAALKRFGLSLDALDEP